MSLYSKFEDILDSSDTFTWTDLPLDESLPVQAERDVENYEKVSLLPSGQILTVASDGSRKMWPLVFGSLDWTMMHELGRFHDKGVFWFYPDADQTSGPDRYQVKWEPNEYRPLLQQGGVYRVEFQLVQAGAA